MPSSFPPADTKTDANFFLRGTDAIARNLMSSHILNVRPQPDQVLVDIADYVMNYKVASDLAYETARNCLIDTLGCGLEALGYPACTKLLGPVVQGTVVPNGAKVPGTQFRLDPVQAAFNIGALIRWLMPLPDSLKIAVSLY